MFIMDQYESAGGHMSYIGVRLSDQIVIKEFVGHYHTNTYINAIEMYAFDGTGIKLIGKRQLDKVRYDENEIRSLTESMLMNFLKSQLMMANQTMDHSAMERQVKEAIGRTYYKLTDCDCRRLLQMAAPVLKNGESNNPMSNLKKALAYDV